MYEVHVQGTVYTVNVEGVLGHWLCKRLVWDNLGNLLASSDDVLVLAWWCNTVKSGGGGTFFSLDWLA